MKLLIMIGLLILSSCSSLRTDRGASKVFVQKELPTAECKEVGTVFGYGFDEVEADVSLRMDAVKSGANIVALSNKDFDGKHHKSYGTAFSCPETE